MKYLIFSLLTLAAITACQSPNQTKIPVFAWMGGPGDATDAQLKTEFTKLKSHGIDGLMYHGGQDPAVYHRVGKIAKDAGLKFEAWIPTMIQKKTDAIDSSWYAVNGKGESALLKPAYVPHYTFLCPGREEVYQYLANMYKAVAAVPEVDGIHLDFIRFPDVILARGLWEKYGLVMDREFPQFDYCYCDKCISDFKAQSGIDIKSAEDPSAVLEWKQFRYDQITRIVNRLADQTHTQGKIISAAVFPGPDSYAKKLVRQEWNKWNLDEVFPMNYNDFYLEGPEWVGKVTGEEVTAVAKEMPVYSGLFICPHPENKTQEKDPENHGLTPEEIPVAIRASMQNGAAGICLFTPGRMTEAGWKAFDQAIRQDYQ